MPEELLLVKSDDLPHVMEGAGAVVKRVVGPSSPVPRVGPLILLDHADIPPGVGFPMHPHAGFEILTYIIRGEVRHKDSEGFQAAVEAGGMQHLFTGRGMWHEEMPGSDGATVLQIWVSLPSEAKGLPPAYRSIPEAEVPKGTDGPLSWRLLASPQGPVVFRRRVYVRDAHADGETEVPSSREGFIRVIYAIQGSAELTVASSRVNAASGDLLLIRGSGSMALQPGEDGFRFALFELPSTR